MRILVCLSLLLASAAASALDWQDPYQVGKLPAASASGSIRSDLGEPCAIADTGAALSISDVVDRALCRNPKSREAWANARYQAAQIGVAKAPFLPSIDANADLSHNWSSGGTQLSNSPYNQLSADVSLSYLLYDFGGRDAALENAQQLFLAASETQDNVVQGLFFSAIQGYYQVNAAQAAVDSAKEAERTSQASLDAATARYKVGVGTPADRLQAQTAHSQDVLNRIRAEGDLKNARGVLANLMGMDADQPYTLQPAPEMPAYAQFQANVADLIAEARRHRPDLAAAEAQVHAARANIDAARSGRWRHRPYGDRPAIHRIRQYLPHPRCE